MQICWFMLNGKHVNLLCINDPKMRERSRNAWQQFYHVTLNKDQTSLCSCILELQINHKVVRKEPLAKRFSTLDEKFRVSARPWNILYLFLE